MLSKKNSQILFMRKLWWSDRKLTRRWYLFCWNTNYKRNVHRKIKKLLEKLENKKIFLFATVGFGGSEEYFATLKERIIGVLPSSNVVIGSFFCQGKMKEQVKARYLQLITENPEDKNLQVSLQNFEQAKPHPDTEDKNNLIKRIKTDLDIK